LTLGYGIPKECEENLPIINKTKHLATKGKKKVQDGRNQVLANKETSKEGQITREWEQIKYPNPYNSPPPPTPSREKHIARILVKIFGLF
jgi:hypothetical protein